MAISVAAHSAQQQSSARVQPGVPGLQPTSPGACGKQAATQDASNSYGFPQLPMPPTFPMGPMFGFPFLPGMVPPMGSSKGGCMLPMPPMMFPHPAQLQAMGAAAQAAMEQAAKQPGGMPACFPMGMFPPLPMMQQQQQQGSAGTTCMQQQQPSPTNSQPATPAAASGAAAAADAEGDDEHDAVPDEDVEVEPELEQIFEKVAAMERAHKAAMAAVQQRACSPSASLHSAATGTGIASNCSSPNAAAAVAPLPMHPVMLCQQQGMRMAAPPAAAAAPAAGEVDAAPVPWLAFAADDKEDDLDADLAQLITLPGEVPRHNNKKSSSSPAGSKPQKPSIKRVSSVSSAYSSGEALAGAAASSLLSGSNSSKAGQQQQQPKVLRIRSIKGATGNAAKPAAGSKGCSARKAPAGLSCKGSSSSTGQQKAAAAGLGAAKAGVQKKVAAGSSISSKAKPSAAAAPARKQQSTQSTQQQAASPAKAPQRSQQKPASPAVAAAEPAAVKAAAAAASPVKSAAAPASPPAAADEPALSLLGDLDSGLSDTCFGSGGDDMAIDSFDYLDELLLQESSEDGWEGLLGGSAAAEEMELCSSLANH